MPKAGAVGVATITKSPAVNEEDEEESSLSTNSSSNGAKQSYIAERRCTPHWKASKGIFAVSHKETSKGRELGSQHVTDRPYGVRIGKRCMAMALSPTLPLQARTGLAQLGGVEVEVAWI